MGDAVLRVSTGTSAFLTMGPGPGPRPGPGPGRDEIRECSLGARRFIGAVPETSMTGRLAERAPSDPVIERTRPAERKAESPVDPQEPDQDSMLSF